MCLYKCPFRVHVGIGIIGGLVRCCSVVLSKDMSTSCMTCMCHCVVNATRVSKKAKPTKSSPDVTISPQKVEGLRNRVKKSSIELAVELRAMRDIPVCRLFVFSLTRYNLVELIIHKLFKWHLCVRVSVC